MKEDLRTMREARGWSIRELAARTGIDHRQLSRYENGARGLAEDHRMVLAREFACHPGDIVAAPARQSGRPRRTEGDLVSRFQVPATYDPTAGRPLSHHLPAARKRNPDLLCALERDTDPCSRAFLQRAPGDSGGEATAILKLLCREAYPTDAAPLEVGFTRFPVVDRYDERTVVGHCKVPSVVCPDWLMILQVTVATPYVYRMDGLIVVTNPIRTYINYEYDGQGHSTAWQEQRTRAIGLPVLRVTEADLHAGFSLTEKLRQMGYCLRNKREDASS